MSACSIQQLPDNFSKAMTSQTDLDITKDSIPAYLVMLDAMVLTYPDDEDMLFSAAKLNGAYGGAFSNSAEQQKKLADKAFNYARRGLCTYEDDYCGFHAMGLEEIKTRLHDADEDDLPYIYQFATSWAGWLQANSDDWNAIAQIPKIKAIMQWVEQTKPSHDHGTALVYLGVLEGQVPPSLGGKPEKARAYFEQAIKQTDGHHLMAKTLFAKYYARLMYDKALHDQLLEDVINQSPEYKDLTLINRLAQEQAKTMLAETNDYFE